MSLYEIPVARQLAKIGVGLKLEDIDARTVQNAKIFLLDCLGGESSWSYGRRAYHVSWYCRKSGGRIH